MRKEELRVIEDQGVSIRQALWAAYADPQHRMKHWITFLTVANLRSQPSQALMDEVALLVALRSQRSRSSRGQRAQKQLLALTDKPTQKGKGGGKGRGKGKNNSKGCRSSGHDTKGAHLFDDSQQKYKNALWHEKAKFRRKTMKRRSEVQQRTRMHRLRSSRRSVQ